MPSSRMYVPAPFKVHPAIAFAFAAARDFGTVIACDGGRPVAASVPFLLKPKKPWTSDKLPPDRLDMLSKAIVGIEMEVETVEGSFKLNQHKPDADNIAVANALAAQGDPDAQAIASRMVALRPHLLYETGGMAAAAVEKV